MILNKKKLTLLVTFYDQENYLKEWIKQIENSEKNINIHFVFDSNKLANKKRILEKLSMKYKGFSFSFNGKTLLKLGSVLEARKYIKTNYIKVIDPDDNIVWEQIFKFANSLEGKRNFYINDTIEVRDKIVSVTNFSEKNFWYGGAGSTISRKLLNNRITKKIKSVNMAEDVFLAMTNLINTKKIIKSKYVFYIYNRNIGILTKKVNEDALADYIDEWNNVKHNFFLLLPLMKYRKNNVFDWPSQRSKEIELEKTNNNKEMANILDSMIDFKLKWMKV